MVKRKCQTPTQMYGHFLIHLNSELNPVPLHFLPPCNSHVSDPHTVKAKKILTLFTKVKY